MPRNPKRHRSPAGLLCPVEACGRNCRTQSGLTRHLRAKHKLEDYQPGTPQSAAAVNDRIILNGDLSSVDDVEMSISPDRDLPPTWDAFSSSHDSVQVDHDFEIQPSLPSESPRPDSPSSGSGISIEYHPLINGE
jgi:hypothetical protein